MLPSEHYFENILFNYKRTGDWNRSIKNDCTKDLSKSEIETIQLCALYIIDNICEWNQENVKKLLSHSLFD